MQSRITLVDLGQAKKFADEFLWVVLSIKHRQIMVLQPMGKLEGWVFVVPFIYVLNRMTTLLYPLDDVVYLFTSDRGLCPKNRLVCMRVIPSERMSLGSMLREFLLRATTLLGLRPQ